MYTNTSEIPSKKIPAKDKTVRDRILPVKALKPPEKPPKALKPPEKPPKALKPPDKPVKTTPDKPKMPAKMTMPVKMTMTTSMSDNEGETKPMKEGKNKRYKTKTTPAEIVAKHKEEHELNKTKYKTEMQAYLKERLKQGKNKIKLENSIKQLEAKIKAA